MPSVECLSFLARYDKYRCQFCRKKVERYYEETRKALADIIRFRLATPDVQSIKEVRISKIVADPFLLYELQRMVPSVVITYEKEYPFYPRDSWDLEK